MKKGLILVIAALTIPSVALAATPTQNATPNGAPKVAYILKGTLSAYTAYNAGTLTNGSITILVKHSNYHARALTTQTLTFAVTANTRISMATGVTAIADGDNGIVKIRAALRIPAADLATTLQAAPARHILDMGAPTP